MTNSTARSDSDREGHTPGPWEACDPGDYGDFDGESRVILGDDRRIAVVHWSPRLNTPQSDANAHLIAAAPDLLAACSDWIEWLKPDSPWREDAADHEARMLHAMRAAIAKARGAA